ncbi:MAG: 4-hydroxythreonine-4-phosphate dehydrogenase PdxA [Bacteroidales bacterium]|nr:4-hydroxythreonine-4-phosphate dehydrogenase PdxA [Bacteroidales bacterium]MDD2425489.1 4-hydroxythreonine-4-phosphate dehydrogenase PdxA [Bacteroidales bacterium]MDD3989787.1 4-hydroxythreonine-4-phosphate dehydrogenase PdxA [Bacteroidales bacterium]MDD4638550.1 4-hydroxythreonine-4-phosphate dehydrogenase PdxA [Bacteroidales bacterium]
MNNKIVIGITQGDANGISYEVIIKALSDQRVLDLCTPVLYGSSKILGYYKKMITEVENFPANLINSAREAHPRRINVVNCIPDSVVPEPGKQNEEGGKGALKALEEAVKELKGGYLDALVTAPFNKYEVSRNGFAFKGHTEYLTDSFGAGSSLMFMVSQVIKIGVVTNHIPVSQISASLTPKLIMDKIILMDQSLRRDFAIPKPKIAVLGLNPHAGDNGLTGDEEENVINPALRELRDKGLLVFGPFSPDGFFAAGEFRKYDAVMAMYHDQGLIPFKTLSFECGVNFTAGLPVVRTSPDHGTAYDLAGKNLASHSSMIAAIYTACDISRNRKDYDQLIANSLQPVNLND